jgi:hypothetical protein
MSRKEDEPWFRAEGFIVIGKKFACLGEGLGFADYVDNKVRIV